MDLHPYAIKFLIGILVAALLLSSCTNTNANSQKSESKVYFSEHSRPPESSFKKEQTYILNTRSKKIHKSSCGTAALIKPENREEYHGNVQDMLNQGYSKCGNCFE